MRRLLELLLVFTLVCSCDITKPEPRKTFDNVFILYSVGYNDLSGSLAEDIETELIQGNLPDKDSRNALVVFAHTSTYSIYDGIYLPDLDFKTPTEPVLIRLYKEGDKPVLDTIKRYPANFDEIDPVDIRTSLNDIKTLFPSFHYGMIYSSHGFGWLPAENTIDTKALGIRYQDSSLRYKETDIREFADAVPMHLDYLMLDACHMSTVEVAYQLRTCCDKLIASGAEVPSTGFDYVKMPDRLFSFAEPNLEQICKDYVEFSQMGATISMIDCIKIESLVNRVSSLVDKYYDQIYQIGVQGRESDVQRMWRFSEYKYFYDLRDIFREAGASSSDLADLDASLSETLLYEDHTDHFLSLKIDRCCGITMYLPFNSSDYQKINDYYKTLDFNKATKLVR